MSSKYRDLFLEQTAFKTPTQALKDALDSVADFVGEMAAEYEGDKTVRPHWLTLSGVSGCGKTMLATEAYKVAVKYFEVSNDAKGFTTVRDIYFNKIRLFTLLEKRLNKWTLITTNLKLKTIQDSYDVRIASRIIRDGNIYRNFKSGDWWLSHFNDSNKGGF